MSDIPIHMPGEWLDEELSDKESQDILTFIEQLGSIKEGSSLTDDDIAEKLIPYLNSFMHLFYRLNKKAERLRTTKDGVIDAKGEPFDLITNTLDFVAYSVVNSARIASFQDIRLPDESVAPIDRVTRMFFQNQLPIDQPVAVESGTAHITQADGKKLKVRIAPVVTLSLRDLPPGIELSRNVEPFDNEVFRAVCSLQDMGNKTFTGHDIYRAMTMNQNALATEATLRMIDTSWKRLTSIAIKLDTGEVGTAYNFARWIKNRRIIEGGDDTVIVKNQHGLYESTVYTLNEEPILKTYAANLKQIGRYPAKWLNTPVNKTPEILILQTALFDHIQAIPSLSSHIRYDTLFSKINISSPNKNAERQKKSKLRSQLHKILDYWTSCGVIDGWSEGKQGNSIYCIIINKKPKLSGHP